MLIDILYAVVLVIAVMNGYRLGLVVGLFSLVATIIGLAAAMKLSLVAAGYIGKAVKGAEEWLPFIAFIVVFIVVVILVRLGAKAIEQAVEVVALGWLNKLGGILFFAALYTIVFSVLLFYAIQMQWVQPSAVSGSITYSFIQPWGPKAINGFGSLIPLFKDMFGELETFFGKVAEKIPPAS
ncbi:MAG: CvpA family protein [Chitinophagaceae bacterium]|nr:CvpA family protein [Chitinophagaceae bacterium]